MLPWDERKLADLHKLFSRKKSTIKEKHANYVCLGVPRITIVLICCNLHTNQLSMTSWERDEPWCVGDSRCFWWDNRVLPCEWANTWASFWGRVERRRETPATLSTWSRWSRKERESRAIRSGMTTREEHFAVNNNNNNKINYPQTSCHHSVSTS